MQVVAALNGALAQGHQARERGEQGSRGIPALPNPSRPHVVMVKSSLSPWDPSPTPVPSCMDVLRHRLPGDTVDLASLFLQRRLKVIEQNLFLIKEIISRRAFFKIALKWLLCSLLFCNKINTKVD